MMTVVLLVIMTGRGVTLHQVPNMEMCGKLSKSFNDQMGVVQVSRALCISGTMYEVQK